MPRPGNGGKTTLCDGMQRLSQQAGRGEKTVRPPSIEQRAGVMFVERGEIYFAED